MDAILRVAGVDRGSCLVTNTFRLRPANNDLGTLLAKRGDPEAWDGWPQLRPGRFLQREYAGELQRLWAELVDANPRVIVPLGGTALWALTGYSNISERHGCWHEWGGPGIERSHTKGVGVEPDDANIHGQPNNVGPNGQRPIPVIPTFHPAFILRQYHYFALAAADLSKAAKVANGTFKLFDPPITPRPTLGDLEGLAHSVSQGAAPVVFDIETSPRFRAITSVGLGVPGCNLCVPFFDIASPGGNYWPTIGEERAAWGFIRRILGRVGPKVAQNGLYDLTWLKSLAGIEVKGPVYDTRLMHHSLVPELPHKLGDIASSYLLMQPWKALRRAAKEED